AAVAGQGGGQLAVLLLLLGLTAFEVEDGGGVLGAPGLERLDLDAAGGRRGSELSIHQRVLVASDGGSVLVEPVSSLTANGFAACVHPRGVVQQVPQSGAHVRWVGERWRRRG
ncbi:unnamed protein product, partial [Ectocarpus sp. 12 AP-2014]